MRPSEKIVFYHLRGTNSARTLLRPPAWAGSVPGRRSIEFRPESYYHFARAPWQGTQNIAQIYSKNDLPEIFDSIVLVPYRNGRARVRQANVALEPFSNSILNSVLASWPDFTLRLGGIVAGPVVLSFMLD